LATEATEISEVKKEWNNGIVEWWANSWFFQYSIIPVFQFLSL
jgi:hypothetical protein